MPAFARALQNYRLVIPLASGFVGEAAMAERRIGQLSFADNLVADAAWANATLKRIRELVDWKEIESLLGGLRSGTMGAPGYPALALFKALLCSSNFTGFPTRSSRKPWPIGCRSDISLGFRSRMMCPTTRHSGGFANNWPKAGWRSAPLP